MQQEQRSILYYAFRSFFRAFCTVTGIGIGFIVVGLVIGGLAAGADKTGITDSTSVRVLPDANGKRRPLQSKTPVILQLDVTGVIGFDDLTMDKVRKVLQESTEGAFDNGRVKALLLLLKTPGGGVIDSDGIHHAIKEYKERFDIPVYAYVDGLCASGGIYVASTADKVYASEASLIGSVGVILSPFINAQELMAKIGLDSLTISAGKGKDTLNPTRKWEENEDENYRHVTNIMYDQFVDLVVAGRPRVDRDKLVNEYGARMFPAQEALDVGFIDEVSNTISSVIQDLAEKTGIENQNYQVVQLTPKRLLSDFFQGKSPLLSGSVTHEFRFGNHWDSRLDGQFLYLWQANMDATP